MKKKTVMISSALLLLTVGGVTALNVINPSWRENTIFATARDKQLAWLKEHEKQIVAWIHSRYPQVEKVQFDWKTLEVGPVSNGVMNVGYNLSVEGTFNDIPETIIFVDFRMETADSIPKMSQIRMNQPPSIKKADGGVYDFE
jgi:lipoprotein